MSPCGRLGLAVNIVLNYIWHALLDARRLRSGLNLAYSKRTPDASFVFSDASVLQDSDGHRCL